jgi:hypothetical protein
MLKLNEISFPASLVKSLETPENCEVQQKERSSFSLHNALFSGSLARTTSNLLPFVACSSLSELPLLPSLEKGSLREKLRKKCEVQRKQGSLVLLHYALFREIPKLSFYKQYSLKLSRQEESDM